MYLFVDLELDLAFIRNKLHQPVSVDQETADRSMDNDSYKIRDK